MNLKHIEITPIKDDRVFENLCLDLWKRKLKDENAQLNGRRGQGQEGVDIFGRRHGTFEWVGIQCKVRSASRKLTKKDVIEEIKKALNFNPKLDEYVIFTTAKRDKALQELARKKTSEHQKDGYFSVTITFWEDIESEITDEKNIDLLYKYYKGLFIDIKQLENVIGKIIELSIGVGDNCDSRYELVIGKTPFRKNSDNFYGIEYYKNTYFIANLAERTMDTFLLPCYPSDLEQVFRFKRDRYIISRWLSLVESIDDIIYGDSVKYKATISQEEYHEYYESLRD